MQIYKFEKFVLPIIFVHSLVDLSVWSTEGESFCGQLEVHKQKWFAPSVSTIASNMTDGLKGCLQFCCDISECDGVSFIGFLPHTPENSSEINPNSNRTNCLLFKCNGKCPVFHRSTSKEGVISVQILRKVEESNNVSNAPQNVSSPFNSSSSSVTPNDSAKEINHTANQSDNLSQQNISVTGDGKQNLFPHNNDTMNSGRNSEDEKDVNSSSSDADSASALDGSSKTAAKQIKDPEKSTAKAEEGKHLSSLIRNGTKNETRSLLNLKSWNEEFPLKAEKVPVWIIGLAIVVILVFLALVITLISMYICYSRQKRRMRSIHIVSNNNTLKPLPTLHAFNPTT